MERKLIKQTASITNYYKISIVLIDHFPNRRNFQLCDQFVLFNAPILAYVYSICT